MSPLHNRDSCDTILFCMSNWNSKSWKYHCEAQIIQDIVRFDRKNTFNKIIARIG